MPDPLVFSLCSWQGGFGPEGASNVLGAHEVAFRGAGGHPLRPSGPLRATFEGLRTPSRELREPFAPLPLRGVPPVASRSPVGASILTARSQGTVGCPTTSPSRSRSYFVMAETASFSRKVQAHSSLRPDEALLIRVLMLYGLALESSSGGALRVVDDAGVYSGVAHRLAIMVPLWGACVVGGGSVS